MKLKYSVLRDQWDVFNREVFDGKLRMPSFLIYGSKADLYIGRCLASAACENIFQIQLNMTYCGEKWADVLLHEMCHQYDWEVLKAYSSFSSHDRFDSYQNLIDSIYGPDVYNVLIEEELEDVS